MTDSPRVSTILTLIYPNNLAWIRQADLDRGTRLHFFMETWLKSLGTNDPRPSMHRYPPDEQLRLHEAMQWFEGSGITPTSVEEHFESKHGYCGHPDLVGDRDGKRIVVDWKFAETLTEMNLMQAEAYRQMMSKKGKPAEVKLVQIANGSKAKVKHCPPNPKLWAVFLSGLAVYKFQHRKDSKHG